LTLTGDPGGTKIEHLAPKQPTQRKLMVEWGWASLMTLLWT